MGLLAIFAGYARNLGLLPKIIKNLHLVSILLVVVGLLNLLVLPLDGQFRETYFSENALLAHQAATFFRESEWDIVRGFKGEIKDLKDRQVDELTRNAQLVDVFNGFGIQAYTHDWQTSDGIHKGQNVYAIHMASRGPHNEAIVIAAPWLAQNGEVNEGATALLLSLARFFQRWNFWHKNLIFLISSNTDIAFREWVNAYHSNLQYTAGSIEGAVVLDYSFESEFYDHVEIDFEGLNGQQPNLDLVNTAVHSGAAEFCGVTAFGIDFADTYLQRLTTMSNHIWQQASAGIRRDQCGSSMLSGWRIDAITIKAIKGIDNYDITTLGRICESTIRSINNLLEHFHQSFFFYLMLGPRYFVSIASYLPSGMLVATSFSIMALYKLANNTGLSLSSGLKAGSTLFCVSLLAILGIWLKSAELALALWFLFSFLALGLSQFLQTADKAILQVLGLGLLGLQLTALSMVNFSLALSFGLVCTPLTWVRPGKNFVLNFLLISLACPALILSGTASGLLNMNLFEILHACIRADTYLHVWSWKLINLIWVPFWLISVICM